MPRILNELDRLSRAEKLDVLQYLVNSFSAASLEYDVPSWHEAELRKTEERVAAGQERPIPWSMAKAVLQKAP